MKKNLLLSFSFLCFGFTACNNAAQNAPAKAEIKKITDVSALLQGTWQSTDDAKSIFEVSGKKIVNVYEGEKSPTETFEFVADCSGNACQGGASTLGCYTIAGQFDITCFSIVNISETNLEVSMAGGTGNTLKYKKVK